MTRRLSDHVVLIEVSPPEPCSYCGAVEECRPYGRDGVPICYECAELPENKDETERRMRALILGEDDS